MSKYDPLGAYLESREAAETPMTFAEVEAVIGSALPPASGRYAAWWSNNPQNNVMTRVWLNAGFRTERVDLAGRKLVFRRVGHRPVAAPLAHQPAHPPGQSAPVAPAAGLLEALRRELRGTVRVRRGTDLTAPTGEAWDAEA
jgi:hypothetical protein